jgi:hypothetical protein
MGSRFLCGCIGPTVEFKEKLVIISRLKNKVIFRLAKISAFRCTD